MRTNEINKYIIIIKIKRKKKKEMKNKKGGGERLLASQSSDRQLGVLEARPKFNKLDGKVSKTKPNSQLFS